MTICATDRYTQLISLGESPVGKIFLFARRTRPTGDKEHAMNRSCRLHPIVFLGFALSVLAALPACGTNDISSDTVLRDNNLQPGPNQGAVVIAFAPLEGTYSEYLADVDRNRRLFLLLVDGKKLVDSDRQLFPMPAGSEYGAGSYEAGLHHLVMNEVGGGTVFEGDGQVTSGALTSLNIFGPLDALQGRFVSYPLEAPPGSEHISAVNLIRSGGVEIEVVSCADATTCTPVSPHLALGDTFDADFPASPPDLPLGQTSLSAEGVGFGYRQVATPSLPIPPIVPLWPAYLGLLDGPAGLQFVAAPEFLLADGTNPLTPVN
jgi:hypothetical protein